MIVKSLSRHSKSFKQLLAYMKIEGRGEGVTHNFPYVSNTPKAVVQVFEENAAHLKKRKNGVVLYHEILSFHPKDKSRVTRQILKNIAEYYLQLRASEGLGYGVFHMENNNPHVHLMISANKLGSSQKIRLSKAQFQRVKQQMTLHVQKHYPFLKNTLKQPIQRKKSSLSQTEEGMNKRNRKTKQLSKKDQVKQTIKNLLQQSLSLSDFETKLQEQGGELYTRGKQTGVLFNGRKYRLKTLGLAEEWEQQQKAWKQVKQREKSVQATVFQKVINEWKGRGFRKQLLTVLQQKKENKRIAQLRETLARKRSKGFTRGRYYSPQ